MIFNISFLQSICKKLHKSINNFSHGQTSSSSSLSHEPSWHLASRTGWPSHEKMHNVPSSAWPDSCKEGTHKSSPSEYERAGQRQPGGIGLFQAPPSQLCKELVSPQVNIQSVPSDTSWPGNVSGKHVHWPPLSGRGGQVSPGAWVVGGSVVVSWESQPSPTTGA